MKLAVARCLFNYLLKGTSCGSSPLRDYTEIGSIKGLTVRGLALRVTDRARVLGTVFTYAIWY